MQVPGTCDLGLDCSGEGIERPFAAGIPMVMSFIRAWYSIATESMAFE